MSAGGGPSAGVRDWGAKLLKYFNKDRGAAQADFITNHLGYDTDNGAFYYYNPEKGKTYERTLLDVHAYSKQVGLPYRHVQIDSWWYIKGESGGTKSWTPANNTFPNRLKSFYDKTGWVFTAHNRMYVGRGRAVHAKKRRTV